jgi:hypothetical protein
MTTTDEQRPDAGLDAQMAALAAEFVQACKDTGLNLDFQPRTLPLVDKYMAGATEKSADRAKPIAAYVGEVIRRETGGAWYEHEGSPALDVGQHQVDPLAAVTQLFERGRAQFGNVRVETTKQFCEWVCGLQRQWLERTLLGTYESMAALRTSMAQDAKLAGLLVAQSQTAVLTAKLKAGETLDYSPDSLEAIERILGKLHNAFRFGSVDPPGDAEIAAAAKVWGIYTGEVIRRHYGGQWSIGADDTLSLSIGETQVFPIAKARKRIIDGPGENIRYYFSAMLKVLEG